MELFVEFVLTIALSLICSFVLAKILSLATTASDHDYESRADHGSSFQKESRDCNWEMERKFGFVSKIVEVHELEVSVDNKKLVTQESSAKEGGEEEEIKKEGQRGVDVIEVNDEVDGIKHEEEEEEDWEGIERSELERNFGAAVAYVGDIGKGKLENLGSDLKLQLHGLHQVAIQGPCHVPQPMPLKFSARSKWNAWQQLGNMSPEEAMEQYINIVSRSTPGWMKDEFVGDKKMKLHA